MRRRQFLAATAVASTAAAQRLPRPNILWVTCEDLSPSLGCFGDKYASTPHLDALASRGTRFRHAWSCAPVCAPARTTIISGMYPPSTGSEHMRSITRLAPDQRMFPRLLREVGYYTSNNVKEDYNLEHTGTVWDDSSAKAHWRGRSPGQLFFSVFNFVITHESQIRKTPHKLQHSPSEVRVPAYLPDVPEVRRDWAQYYDNIVTMDGMVNKVLTELKEDGLEENTVVFFYSDHGAGMPRSKRWPYNSGCQVPMIAYFPERFKQLAPRDYQPNGWTEQLVSFVDLAPTMLSIAGIKKPEYHQGYSFAGHYPEPPQPYIYGFRGRMDERIDMVRSVRSKQYTYIRNYYPHRIQGQHLAYMWEMPTTRKWKELYDQGKLNEAQRHFWEPKPAEELYDLNADPDEIQNLAVKPNPEQQAVLNQMREAQQSLALRIQDVGFLPEYEMHRRAGSDAPYRMGHDPQRYNALRVINMAELATKARPSEVPVLLTALTDKDNAIRYWAAIGLLRQGKELTASALEALRKALADEAPNVAIIAAEALARYGAAADRKPAVEVLLQYGNAKTNGNLLATAALNSLTEVGGAALKPWRRQIEALPVENEKEPERQRTYVPRLREYLLEITA